MPADLERLPSTSITALRLLELANRSSVSVADVEQAVGGDPATVVALLQASGRNCAVAERCTSVRAAIERLGVPRALCVCLGFRLLVRRRPISDIDYIRYWQHAVLRSAYAGAIARYLRRTDLDCITTAAVLRNIAVLIDRNVDSSMSHSVETSAGWLEARNVSSVICDLVAAGHGGHACLSDIDEATGCIVLAENMADVWLCSDWQTTITSTQALAQHMFGAIPDLCAWVFGILGPQAVELESLLQIRHLGRCKIIELYKSACRLRSLNCIVATQATGVAFDND
jgi:hypothetical protein